MTPSAAEAARAPRHWTGKTRGGLAGNWIFVTLVKTLGLRCAYALLVPVSFYFLFFAPTALASTFDYRRRLGLGGSIFARYWWAWRHFFAFGRLLLDRVAIVTGASDRFTFEHEGEDGFLAAIREGKGAVIITAHIGSWEAAAHLLGDAGTRVNVVAYEGEAQRIRKLFDRTFEDKAFSLIQSDGSPEAVLKIRAALARGEIVAMNGDRAAGARAVKASFLGAEVPFPAGPYMVAAMSGAPVIHTFLVREGAYRYRVYTLGVEHPAFETSADRDRLMRQWVGGYAAHLEEMVRKYPLQWQNFYDFWGADAKA